MTSSFKKSKDIRTKAIGFRPSGINGTSITSTGIRTLDELMGGGIPISSSLLIQEDEDGAYSKLILKYIMAQGIASKQNLILIGSSFDSSCDPHQVIHSLMALDQANQTLDSTLDEQDDDDDDDPNLKNQRMKIAWRYENLNQNQNDPESEESFCFKFDLKRKMKLSSSETNRIHCIDVKEGVEDLNARIKKIIETDSKASYRIIIQSIGSIGWPLLADHEIFNIIRDLQNLIQDQHSSTVAIVTYPRTYRSIQLSKTLPWVTNGSISLKSFAGDERSQAAFPNHHGSVQFIRIPSNGLIGSPTQNLSQIDTLLGFKLQSRKGFQIELMGLGLDIDNEHSDQDQNQNQKIEDKDQIHSNSNSRVKVKVKSKVRFNADSKNTDW